MKDKDRGSQTELHTDAVIIGGGLAGQAAAIHLARTGMQVLCLEPRENFPDIVGESLDWSAPHLLAQLGLPMEELVASGAATWKRHIVVTASDGAQQQYLPGPWLAERPWNVETRTLHLERQQIHTLLQKAVHDHGVATLRERAIGFDTHDRRISTVKTAEGSCIHATCIIDASGAAASVLGKEFSIPSAAYGPRKVALWAHFPTDDRLEGTTLYALSSGGAYMEWLWQIPVTPGITSVGYVAPGSAIKVGRASGLKNPDLLSQQMQRFPGLRALLQHSSPDKVASTSFLCRTYASTCGPNWVIIGEAASQSDPITGNGVTAALRHADEATALIRIYQHRGTIPFLARTAYNLRVSGVGRCFNSLIEKLYYQPPVRSLLGLFGTARAYTVPAWLTNLVYSRTQPRRIAGTIILCSALVTLRAAAWMLFQVSRLLQTKPRHLNQTAPAAERPHRALHSPG